MTLKDYKYSEQPKVSVYISLHQGCVRSVCWKKICKNVLNVIFDAKVHGRKPEKITWSFCFNVC